MSNAHHELEEGTRLQLDYTKIGKVAATGSNVVPVAVQNVDTGEVILIAYANEKALQASIDSRIATFWSTSRNELWVKGKTSGETFEIIDIFVNCEQNSLLYTVRPHKGGICHTKNQHGEPRNCYYRRMNFETGQLENMNP